jgi:hypothetical protein
MAIQYRIYASPPLGGPVDYSAPVATVAGLSWSSGSLSANARQTFAVRAYDTDTGLEDQNVDARLTVSLDALGNDITGLPNAPTGLGVRATAAGGAAVTWHYNPGGQGAAPSVFHVYIGTPTPDYGSPAAIVPYVRGGRAFLASLSGLADGVAYQVGVRAVNASGEEQNTATASVVGAVSGPLPVVSLTASAVA